MLNKIRIACLFFPIALISLSSQAQTAISVGELEVDPPTLAALGFALPITAGDTDYDAQAVVHYRVVESGAWVRAMDFMRVRPEFGKNPSRRQEFAGSIMGLTPATAYDVRVTVTDPDGGSATRTVTTRTRALPPSDPATPRQVRVTTFAELTTAISGAAPGDVILLAPGTYSGNLVIRRSGTAANPIFLRGEDRENSIILSLSGVAITVLADYITVENLTVQGNGIDSGVPTGLQMAFRVDNQRNITLRNNRVIGKDIGYRAWYTTNRDHTIYNNVFAGNDAWAAVDAGNATWNDEGIAISGQGHAVFSNTLYGFGDALGLMAHSADINTNNMSIDFYRNDVIWTCDDGIELDESFRNVRAWENRILNSNHGLAEQSNNTDHGGPTYFVRNVVANTKTGAIKLNNGTSGVYWLHNTSIRSGDWGYVSFNVGGHANYRAINNVVVNMKPTGKTFAHEAPIDLATSDVTYFGFYPDRNYWFGANSVSDVAVLSEVLSQSTPLLRNSRILTLPIFQSDFAIGPDHRTMVDPSKQSVDVTLSSASNAIDAGRIIVGLNEDFAGAGPDLGAYERGKPIPSYGASFKVDASARRPLPPTSLSAQ